MPRFLLRGVQPARFQDDFVVEAVPPHAPDAAERQYLDQVHAILGFLADDIADAGAEEDEVAAAIRQRLTAERDKVARQLRLDAEEFCAGSLSAATAAANCLVIKGEYRFIARWIRSQLFHVEVMRDAADLATGLVIKVNPALPAAPADKQVLFVAIENAERVILTVCRHIEERAERNIGKWYREDAAKAELARTRELRDRYVGKLAGIGRLGLSGPHTHLSSLALEGLRSEFVAQEAGRIKNAYIRSLGVWALLAAAVLLVPYLLIESAAAPTAFMTGLKGFLVAGIGAAVGAWLSFSIRRMTLSFNDLAILEEDFLDPGIRIVFVLGLTLAACLLFDTGAMNIEIGELKTGKLVGSTALLVGIFLGLSERGLATAISGRAASFVKGIGGS